MRSVVVCLPTYNEAENIELVIDGLFAAEASLHILVVDDGSPDGTGDIVARRAAGDPRISLIRRPGRLGLGTAYIAAFSQGLEQEHTHFLTMDSDLSHAPDRVPALIAAVDAGADLAIGSRYRPGGSIVGWGLHRRVLSFGANSFAKLWLGIRAKDCTSGFRCYRRVAVELLVQAPVRARGYSTLVELLVRCQRAGFTVVEVPIRFVDRVHGKSKMSSREMIDGIASVVTLGSALAAEKAQRPGVGEPVAEPDGPA
ncbi:MAG: polyprenol monophosphomannose synthase [Candidatus Dormibacteraeota bacterium]|nr:polyprenol monophosphomannose synthase [Candidatus Dormibacteraeota bacterium]